MCLGLELNILLKACVLSKNMLALEGIWSVLSKLIPGIVCNCNMKEATLTGQIMFPDPFHLLFVRLLNIGERFWYSMCDIAGCGDRRLQWPARRHARSVSYIIWVGSSKFAWKWRASSGEPYILHAPKSYRQAWTASTTACGLVNVTIGPVFFCKIILFVCTFCK